MSASLVGSEMCIRDSVTRAASTPPDRLRESRQAAEPLRLTPEANRMGELEREIQHLPNAPRKECLRWGQVNQEECPCQQYIVSTHRSCPA
eukprot:10628772-Alexandrium_andersonii.AAC.1